jgi:hypothetical protein
MTNRKLTPQEFREDFPGDLSDESVARDVVQYLDEFEGGSVVRAARAYLEAATAFEEALVSAGLRRGL